MSCLANLQNLPRQRLIPPQHRPRRPVRLDKVDFHLRSENLVRRLGRVDEPKQRYIRRVALWRCVRRYQIQRNLLVSEFHLGLFLVNLLKEK